MSNLKFLPEAWKDYVYWQEQDRKTLNKINKILNDISRNPFSGIGKPEQLKGNLAGWWSRRIDDKNRIVYRMPDNDNLEIAQCKGHYSD